MDVQLRDLSVSKVCAKYEQIRCRSYPPMHICTSGGSLSMHNIYLPSYNSISLDVQLAELNKEKALAKAKEEMATTLEVINQNNPDAERWSATLSALIEQMADKKRKELLAFYS